MRYYLVFVFFYFGITAGNGQYWMQSGGGPTIDEGMDVDADGSAHVVATGYFTSGATFSGISVSAVGADDIFIMKTNDSGSVLWVKTAGGINVDKPLSIDVDSAGNIAVTGFYYSSAQFDAQVISSNGQQDVFVAKYDSSGTLLWVKSAGGAGSDIGNSVSIDITGNVVVTGEFSGTCDFGSGISLTSLAGTIDVFTAKYSSAGTILWAKRGAGMYTDRGTDISTDAGGNVYVSGIFSDTVTFDQTHYNTIYNAMFLIKYNPAGQEQWFRWLGSGGTVGIGGIDVHAGDINMTGSFNGSLFFFDGTSTTFLPGPQVNNIFVCRYDTSGNMLWSHADGSESEVSAECIASRSDGSIVIAGNFKCRFTDLSSQYGTGIFCSIGYWDSYVAAYDNSGNRLWGRHYATPIDDNVKGICVRLDTVIATIGDFGGTMYSTVNPSQFLGYGTTNILNGGLYCLDSNYGKYVSLSSAGNRDMYLNSNIDLSREPLDFFYRSGSTCDRQAYDLCIDKTLTPNLDCMDTLEGCGGLSLYANTLTDYRFGYGPVFTYLWDNGNTSRGRFVLADGSYSVTATSLDGCYIVTDSVFVVLHPNPEQPRISDSKGINVDTTITQLIRLCLPDTVQLLCTNVGSNSVQWSGYSPGQNPIIVNSPGNYSCQFTDSNGCTSGATTVSVSSSDPLPVVIGNMRTLEDQDNNDTIELCKDDFFSMYLFDSLSNPLGDSISCFPEMDSAHWSTTADSVLSFLEVSTCNPNSVSFFSPTVVGDFDIIITAWIKRANDCDSDTVYMNSFIHIKVNPLPGASGLPITVSGPSNICFGDTVMLVTSGGPNLVWSTGEDADTIYVYAPGYYSASITDTVTNSFGCSGVSEGFAALGISYYSQPSIASDPPNGLICLNDSVLLICTGQGTYNWQGPTGSLGINDDSVYVTIPGFYYCVLSVAPGCDLVSNTLQVTQYSTPFLAYFPSNSLCETDSVIITAVSNAGSLLQWQLPFSGSASYQVAYSPGTYVCNITSCNIITPASLTVFQDTAYSVISADKTILCEGDSVMLVSDSVMAGYLWLPSNDTTQSIYVTQGGTDTLITSTIHGCMDTSVISLVQDAAYSVISSSGTIFCQDDSMQLFSDSVMTGYLWLPSGDTTQNIFVSDGGIHTLITASIYGCTDTSAISIIEEDAFSVISSSQTAFCEGDSVLLVSDSTMANYLWLPSGDTTQNIYVTQGGTDTLITSTNNGCADTSVIVINEILNTLSPPLISDTLICSGYPLTLVASGSDTIFWSTSPSYPDVFYSGSTYHIPSVNTGFIFYLFTGNGLCKSGFDSLTVDVDTTCNTIKIPNVFSPNNDYLNDFFPQTSGDYLLDMKIFNRWGSIVYESMGQSNGWNGRNKEGEPVPDGTYFFTLRVTFRDNFVREYTGPLMVVGSK